VTLASPAAFTVADPVNPADSKSLASTSPVALQYRDSPSGTPVVATVVVSVPPSLTEFGGDCVTL